MKSGFRKLAQAITAGATIATSTHPAVAKDLTLAYFMGPRHPMNAAVFTPFAERLAEVSGGEMTVKQFPGGALNSVPPKQYSIMLDGVADIIFTLPGYTSDLFPKTNVVNFPHVCGSPLDCTRALLNARHELEKEYDAKVLAIWSNAPPVLITRDKPVRTLEDLRGMKIRVVSKHSAPFVEALGASAVAQPVTVIHQNLANGVIDAIAIPPSAIHPFKLHEPANFITTYFPGSGSAFVLLLNRKVYDSLSDQQKAWIDAVSGEDLSLMGGRGFEKADVRGLRAAREAGVEIIELSEPEKARFDAAADTVLDTISSQLVGDKTVSEIISLMKQTDS